MPRRNESGQRQAAKLRVVADTSSLVRAALNGASAAGQLMARLLVDSNSGNLVVSAALLAELAEVLGRRKFAGRLAAEQRRRFMLRVQAAAQWVEPVDPVRDCRDPADDMVLEAALAAMRGPGETVVIVSDDQDLLTLDPWRGVRIVKPEAALAMLAAEEL